MSLTEAEKFHLKKFIKELENFRGRHTELVSVYIPQDYDMNKIINHLAQEQGTASNIKSASTRKNVTDALERMIQHLRLFKRTPPNGLVVFSGNVAEREGQQNFKVWSIEPPIPLKTRIYRCDKEFVLDILSEMLEAKEVYGLVVMDRRDANIALLKGKSIIPLVKTHSEVPGKFKAGGQCLSPDTKILVNENVFVPIGEFQVGNNLITFDFKNKILKNASCLDFWEKKVSELYKIKTKNSEIKCSRNHIFFVKKNNEEVEIPARNLKVGDNLFFVKNEGVVEDRIVDISSENGEFKLIDISVKNQNFIANGLIVHNSAMRFSRQIEGAAKDHYKKVGEYMKETFLKMDGLKGIIVGGPGPTKYDFVEGDFITNEVKKKIIGIKDLSYTGEFGLEELLEKSADVLAQEDVMEEKKIVGRFLETLATKQKMASYGEADVMSKLKMGVVDILLLSEALSDEKIEEFEEAAKPVGTNVRIISVQTREGVQLRELGKVAAILRYEVHT